MKTHREETERQIIAEQAAQWLCDLREGEPQVQAAFLTWLRKSPHHVAEFLFAATMWREVRESGFNETVDVDVLVSQALMDEGRSNIVPLAADVQGRPKSLQNPRIVRWIPAAVASIALLALAWMLAPRLTQLQAPIYSTTTGEQRAFKLVDGSMVHLNTRSRIELRFSARAREVRLLEGEALFTVQQDAARPFRVAAGNTVIRAIGTQFNVYRRARDTTVAVISGVVQIGRAPALRPRDTLEEIRLEAGQEARLADDGHVLRTDPDVAGALAWRERRLVFRGTRLEDIAREFNRYNRRHIRVDGEIARAKTLSGTFDADDPDSLVLFLRKLQDLSVEAEGEGLVIRAR